MLSEHTTIPLLGVGISKLNRQETLSAIKMALTKKRDFSYIVTANPEIILQGQQDENYRRALIAGDIVTVDGIGLLFANMCINGTKPPRITGISLTQYLIRIAEQNKYSILIINQKTGLSSKSMILNYFKKTHPHITLEVINIDKNNIKEDKIIKIVDKKLPDIILVSLGAPHQERVLNLIKKKSQVKGVGIGNGASIDFIIGAQKRAPKAFQQIGMEWLWRLITRPNRALRIINATIKFPLFVIYWRLRMICKYRHTAMGCIINQQNEILIAHFPECNQWGFPKGGVENNETFEKAAKREMYEELGIPSNKLSLLYKKKHIYSYKWPHWHKANRGYKGQKVSLCVFRFKGNNENIKPDLYEVNKIKWVPPKNLLTEVSQNRKEIAKKVQEILNNTPT